MSSLRLKTRAKRPTTRCKADADQSLADRVYHYVTEQVLNGYWPSGHVIDRKQLAQDLDVSGAPVGEAMIRLANEGLLERDARRYTRVRVVKKEDVRGQLVLRMALERQAVAMVHGEPVRQAKHRLIALARQVDRFTPGDPAAWPAEIEFHQALVDLAGCEALSASHERVMRRNYFFATNSAHLRISYSSRDQHVTLVDQLCTEDPEEADRAILAAFANHREVLSLRIASHTE
jgi:DNA-binding GntR family transcriptional regulator